MNNFNYDITPYNSINSMPNINFPSSTSSLAAQQHYYYYHQQIHQPRNHKQNNPQTNRTTSKNIHSANRTTSKNMATQISSSPKLHSSSSSTPDPVVTDLQGTMDIRGVQQLVAHENYLPVNRVNTHIMNNNIMKPPAMTLSASQMSMGTISCPTTHSDLNDSNDEGSFSSDESDSENDTTSHNNNHTHSYNNINNNAIRGRNELNPDTILEHEDSENRNRYGNLMKRPSYIQILEDLAKANTDIKKEPIRDHDCLDQDNMHMATINQEGMQNQMPLTLASGQKLYLPNNQVVVAATSSIPNSSMLASISQNQQANLRPTLANSPYQQLQPPLLSPALFMTPQALSTQHQIAEEAAKKREIRLMKNRIAAKECRRKKKEYVKCLESRVQVLESQNKQLIDELKSLKDMYIPKNNSESNGQIQSQHSNSRTSNSEIIPSNQIKESSTSSLNDMHA